VVYWSLLLTLVLHYRVDTGMIRVSGMMANNLHVRTFTTQRATELEPNICDIDYTHERNDIFISYLKYSSHTRMSSPYVHICGMHPPH